MDVISKKFDMILNANNTSIYTNKEFFCKNDDSIEFTIKVLEGEKFKDLSNCSFIFISIINGKGIIEQRVEDFKIEDGALIFYPKKIFTSSIGNILSELIIYNQDKSITTQSFNFSVRKSINPMVENEEIVELDSLRVLHDLLEKYRIDLIEINRDTEYLKNINLDIEIQEKLRVEEFNNIKNDNVKFKDHILDKVHNHQNKNILDTITEEKIKEWSTISSYDDTEVKAQLEQIDQQKATKTELNALGQLKLGGTYSTLADLQTAFPTGATGLYLVTADGWTYRWDGLSWVRASQFQSTGIADGSVLDRQLQESYTPESKVLVNYTTNGTATALYIPNKPLEKGVVTATFSANAIASGYFYLFERIGTTYGFNLIKKVSVNVVAGENNINLGIIAKGNGQEYIGFSGFIIKYKSTGGTIGFYSKSNYNGIETPIILTSAQLGSTLDFSLYLTYSNRVIAEKIIEIEKGVEGIITVAKNGGNYKTIQEAVNVASDGDIIHVMPGIYEEAVSAWKNKNVRILGVDKTVCILKNTIGLYTEPPLEISRGSVCNMTIYAEKPIDFVETDNSLNRSCYALHVESSYSADSKLDFYNCDIISDWSASAGVGLRRNFTLTFRDCRLITNATNTQLGASSSDTFGALYFHDAPSTSDTYGENQKIIVDNCKIISANAKVVQAKAVNQVEGNNAYATFYNTMAYSKLNKKTGIIDRTTPNGSSWAGSNIFLTEDSYGNNVTELNA